MKDCGRNGLLKGYGTVGQSRLVTASLYHKSSIVTVDQFSLSFSSSPAKAVRAYNNLDTVSIITTVYKFVATVSFTAVGHPSIQADYQIMSVSIMSVSGDTCHSYTGYRFHTDQLAIQSEPVDRWLY